MVVDDKRGWTKKKTTVGNSGYLRKNQPRHDELSNRCHRHRGLCKRNRLPQRHNTDWPKKPRTILTRASTINVPWLHLVFTVTCFIHHLKIGASITIIVNITRIIPVFSPLFTSYTIEWCRLSLKGCVCMIPIIVLDILIGYFARAMPFLTIWARL